MKKRLIIISTLTTTVLAVIVLVFVLTHNNTEAASSVDYSNLSGLSTSLGEEQNYWNGHGPQSIATAEDGYYFITPEGAYLMYFDINTKDVIPVCGKADCSHTDESCGSFLRDEMYVLGNIYYHQEKLYYMPVVDGNAVLVEMDTTGSNRKEIATIMPSKGNSGLHLTFHGRYAYAYDFVSHASANEEYTERIIEISLDTGKTNVIYEKTGVNVTIQNVKSYGNKLFFTVQQINFDEKKNYAVSKGFGLFAYDYQSREVLTVSTDNIHDYCVLPEENLIYYYVTGEGLYKSDINNKQTTMIMKSTNEIDMCNISYDGTYIYISNLKWVGYMQVLLGEDCKKCLVLDKEGSIINEISCEEFLGIYFGDDRYMFARMRGEGSENGLVYIEKKDMENVKEWTRVMEEAFYLETVK